MSNNGLLRQIAMFRNAHIIVGVTLKHHSHKSLESCQPQVDTVLG